MTTARTDRSRRTRAALRGLSWVAFLVALVAWAVWLAPTSIGGRGTYALVDGHSMEPMLRTGDLVVATAQPRYAIGDLVVYASDSGGLIVHRIVDGSASTGWTTQGDNNSWLDPWTVPDRHIRGRYLATVPQVGRAMAWAHLNPLPLAGALAAVCLLPYLPWHRRRLSTELAAALASGHREPHREGRPASDYAVLAGSAFAALVSAAALTALHAAGRIASATGALTGAGLLVSGTVAVCLAYRLYDGRWLPEPTRSVYALSGRLYRVHGLPHVSTPPTLVRSAVALRSLAEKHRLPVLHRVDKGTGVHEFLLITVEEGSFLWQAAAPGSTADDEPAELVAVAAIPAPAQVDDDLLPWPGERVDRRRAVRRGRWRSRRRQVSAHHQHRAR